MSRPRLSLAASCALGLGVGAAFAAAPSAWEDYQVIVERAPFGSVLGAADAAAQPHFAARFIFAGIVPSETDGQLLAIIFDTERNRSELVAPGESIGDVKLISLDAAAENSKIVIQRGLEPATLRLKPRDTAIPVAISGPVGVAQPVANPPVVRTGEDGAARTVVVPARRRIPFRRGEE